MIGRRALPRRLLRISVAGLTLLAGCAAAWGAGTRTWTATPQDLARGESDGVAVTGQGVLFPAPALTRLSPQPLAGEPSQVWAMAADRVGNVYLGTGPDGRVVRVDAAGGQAVHYTVDDPLVTALAVAPDGSLLVGTSPRGRIHRVRSQGRGELWSETGERYVWALAVDAAGTVFAGTGERGAVLRISSSGTPEVFFDSDEAHVVALAPTPDGGLLAGGAGRGLVYRIDAAGNGSVLFEDELPEASALTREADGSVLAAFLAPPEPEAKPPALRLRLPEGVQVGRTTESVGALEESAGPVLRGLIEGLPEGVEARAPRPRGRLVRIAADGSGEELWSSREEAAFCLVRDADGRVLFGTGEPARLYRVDPEGDVALLTTLREAQVTELLPVGGSILVGTSNPAAIYRLTGAGTQPGVFLSRPFDAGGPARWGAIGWVGTGSAEVYTRTGNSREPDATWSAWGPALTDPRRSRVVNPDGRYLQWRVRFPGVSGRISSVTVDYAPYNRAPRVRGFRLDATESSVAALAPFRWERSDPDGDAVEVTLQYRAAGSEGWSAATWTDLLEPSGAGAGWAEVRATWDTTTLAEGPYRVRALVTDQPANHPGEGREVVVESPRTVVVDRSPPQIEVSKTGAAAYRVIVRDTHSAVRRLEVLADGATRMTLRPRDGVCDSPLEEFELALPEGAAGRALRGFDAAGNRVEASLPQ